MLILSITTKTVVSAKISTYGIDLENIEAEKEAYKTENMILKEKLLTLTSLNHVASEAAQLGFVESKSSLVFSKSLPLTAKR